MTYFCRPFDEMEKMHTFLVHDNDAIRLNSSKSLVIRELVARFLYRGELLDIVPEDSEDVRVTHRCLSVVRNAKELSAPVLVDAGDCGAAFRFLMALLAVTEGEWLLTGTPRLLQRPVNPLVTALRTAGAAITPAPNGWHITGRPLHAETLTVDCTLSSQFASALLLIGPKIGLKELSILPDVPPSAPYIAMTRRVLDGVLSGTPLRREADWSTAAFWYAVVLLSPDVDTLLLRDLHLDIVQGDVVISQIFSKLGVSSEQKDEGVLVKKMPDFNHNFNLNLNLKSTPDIAPVLAVTAAMLGVPCTLTGLENLNLKESCRLEVLAQELSPFAHVSVADGTLRINGRKTLQNGSGAPLEVNTHGDHRMVMAFALLSLKYNVHLSDIECVKKSYPEFENYFNPAPRIGK